MQFEKWYDIDLKKPRQFMPDLGFPVFKGDVNSVRVGVHMFSNKEPLDVTGSVEGYVLLPNGAMAPVITGEKEGNAVWIDLSELSLAIIGRIQIAIRLVDGTEATVIFCATATVRRIGSETIIDPDDVIPTWDDILTKIAQMDAAADACNDAAEAAEDAAEGALANFAPAFAEATANAAGSYVTYTDGKMYLLPNGHTVNTTWANTTKSEVKVGGELTDLKGAFDNLTKLNISFSVSGALNNSTGSVSENANYACTELIDLTGVWAGIGYVVKSYNGIAIACLYNDTKAFISSVIVDNSSVIETSGIISNFSGAKYIRFCSNIQNSYIPKLFYSGLKDIKVLGKAISVNNVTFSEHDKITNLIDLSKCSLGYINGGTDGSVHYSATMYVTDFIPLDAGKQYYYNDNYLFKGYYAFYNSSKTYISGGGSGSGAVYLSSPFTPPPGTAYGRFTIVSQDKLANAWLCETNQMATKPADYAENIKTKFVPMKPTFYAGNEITVFTKILCIGDSLTDGAFNESGGSRLIMRNRAFPAKLQALTGVECTNLGYAGYTSAQWYEAYENEDVSGHDACIIQLGVNDALYNVSEADMDAALSSIVTKVKNENSGIKIFIATIIPANNYMTTTMRTRSQMIRDFVSSLNDSNVYLVDLWTYGRTDDYLAYDAGHLSALGYLRLAEDYKAYISYIIHNNPNDFRYVQFIGTNYTYSANTYVRSITY